MKYKKIFVFGDSYSVNYPLWLEKLVACPVINCANIGSSNDKIFRLVTENLIDCDENIFVILGYSFFERKEILLDEHTLNKSREKLITYNNEPMVTLNQFIHSTDNQNIKRQIVDIDVNLQIIHHMTQLAMIQNFLKAKQIDYLIFSAPYGNIDVNVPKFFENSKIMKSLKEDNAVFDYRNFSVASWAKKHKVKITKTHHIENEEGQKKFAQWLIQTCKLNS